VGVLGDAHRGCSLRFIMPLSPVPVILGCWADLFELSQFRPKCRRFFGPGTWDAVRSHRPDDWGWPFDSLIVGPAAYAQIYRGDDDARTVAWFLPGERVANLLEHVSDEADSLRLVDRAPGKSDPAFAAYARAVARRGSTKPRGHRR
jgi:hypothetical protein